MSQVTSESILTTKSIVEQAIQDYHRRILPYLNGEFPIAVVEKFAPRNLYTTDEKIIGQWIDGKPIYQKTFSGVLSTSNTEESIAHNISNVDLCIERKGFIVSNNFTIQFGFYNGSEYNNMFMDKTNLNFRHSRVYASCPYKVTVLYTKITDEPVEFGTDTDYSTTEKVIGTWIDGKPIYQIVSDLEDPTAGVLFKPDMTGNNEPSPYAVTSSTLYNTNMQPYKAFDDVRYTPSDPDYRTGADAYYWMSSAVANSWIKIDLGENNAKEFASVGIGGLKTSTYDGRSCMPKSFTVSGSNDDSNYTTLYTSDPNRENSANENNHYVETFNFTTTGSYRYYKIDISTSFGSENIRIDCIKFKEQGLIRNVDIVLSNVVKGGKHVLQYTKTTD